MSLAFLLPAGLAALAALLLPLLLHLARRHEQTPTDFAALRWLRQKPKPRHRIRFDEWPLLLLRLLLLALLALWLARPVLSGLDDDRPWQVVVPGVDAGLARTQATDPRTRLHWLAPGFPSLDAPAPTDTPAIGSLLRQLDAELPPGVALTVVVPSTLQGADAERPTLSRDVAWNIVDGAMPATNAAPPSPLALVVRQAAGDERGLRYLRAAARAWQPANATAAPLQVGTPDAPLPAPTHPLVWQVPGPVPSTVMQWIAAGGTALLDSDATLDGVAMTSVAWRDADGTPLVEATAHGRGRVMRFTRPLRPDAMPVLVDADFPHQLRALFDPPADAPSRVSAADYAPVGGGASYPVAPRDLQPWLALLIALLALIERWMATRRTRSVAP
ncbi:N-terminal double-transmembrane domain-containing protein [Pseudoxanthomonas sp. CF385]|uniref:BatA domain-containing protein n=1 Tax=Pseudoxanthomonas sp. CF385 TaxID=1881042 RepID=UPI0008921716|nr:BatA domain-containing protein [Pseudoxanthomonas sp. CF385]SDQ21338.1 N-terminal double-transmembrane domain-containing protein [Pseudoxanthomonas sp. CF385]